MKAERARLCRLQRLESMRAIARHRALVEAGHAESRLRTLEQLGQRTAALIMTYAARTDARHGADLIGQQIYVRELHRLAGTTATDVAQARAIADQRAADAAAAERNRAAVADRATATQARINRHRVAAATPLSARKLRT